MCVTTITVVCGVTDAYAQQRLTLVVVHPGGRLVKGAAWESDDAEKEQFRRGVVSMMHKTLLELHDMKQDPHCAPRHAYTCHMVDELC